MSAAKQFFRRRRAGQKWAFRLTIVSASGLPEGEPVSVHWRRGDKPENAGETPRKLAIDGRVALNETAALLCTLFPSGNGAGGGTTLYDAKEVVFTVRLWRGERAAVLGRATLDLARFAGVGGALSQQPQTRVLTVRNAQRRALSNLNVAVSASPAAATAEGSSATSSAPSSEADADAAASPTDASVAAATAAAAAESTPIKRKGRRAAVSSLALAAAADDDEDSVSLALLTRVLGAALEQDFVPPGMPRAAFELLEHLAAARVFELVSGSAAASAASSPSSLSPVVVASASSTPTKEGKHHNKDHHHQQQQQQQQSAAFAAVRRFSRTLAVCRKVHAWSLPALMQWLCTAMWLVREATPRVPPCRAAPEPIRVAAPAELRALPQASSPDKLLLHELQAFLTDTFLAALERSYRDLRLSFSTLTETAAPGQPPPLHRLTAAGVLCASLRAMTEARLPESVRAQYAAQLCHWLSATLMGLLASTPELVTCDFGLRIKLELSAIDEQLQKDPPIVAVARPWLEPIREAATLLAMNKQLLLDEAATRQTFPALTWSQIATLVSSFSTDTISHERIDPSIVRAAQSRAQHSSTHQQRPASPEDPNRFVC